MAPTSVRKLELGSLENGPGTAAIQDLSKRGYAREPSGSGKSISRDLATRSRRSCCSVPEELARFSGRIGEVWEELNSEAVKRKEDSSRTRKMEG